MPCVCLSVDVTTMLEVCEWKTEVFSCHVELSVFHDQEVLVCLYQTQLGETRMSVADLGGGTPGMHPLIISGHNFKH